MTKEINAHDSEEVRIAVRVPLSLKTALELRAAGGEGKTISEIIRRELVEAPKLRERVKQLEEEGNGHPKTEPSDPSELQRKVAAQEEQLRKQGKTIERLWSDVRNLKKGQAKQH